LQAPHYIPTEQSWQEAGAPTACVQLAATTSELVLDLDVRTGPVVCADGPRDNPLDNERDDINADGVQVYWRSPANAVWSNAALIVPVEPHQARITPLSLGDLQPPTVTWTATPAGWAMRLRWDREQLPIDAAGTVAFDLLVNERPANRERRRGQLALSGGIGFGYLRGDRQDPERALVLSIGNPPP
jgi:hypothetical protein